MILEVKNLRKIYKTFSGRKIVALDDLSFEVEKGDVYGFLGPNGAGKTTTIKLILNLLKPTHGKILINGIDWRELKAKADLGYLPEQPYFYDFLTLEEHFNFFAKFFNFTSKEIHNKRDELFELVQLKGFEGLKIAECSKGMKQRFSLAQALISNPELLILDEPASGLDPIGRKDIRDIIINLKDQGKTIFFSSHEISQVEMICNKVIILNKGKLAHSGDVDNIMYADQGYEITLKNIDKTLLNELQTNSDKLYQTEKGVIIEVNNATNLYALLDKVKTTNANVFSVLPRKQSLENIFVSLVNKEKDK